MEVWRRRVPLPRFPPPAADVSVVWVVQYDVPNAKVPRHLDRMTYAKCNNCGDVIGHHDDAVAGPDGLLCRDCADRWPAYSSGHE